jgi:hypothetical protein
VATPARPAPDTRALIQRILDTPHLDRVVPRLPADALHRIMERCGVEACGDLLALATPEQLTRVADLDLWHRPRPGLDDAFDPARFAQWLEALLEAGPSAAARTLAAMDPALVAAGLSHHVRVFDVGSVRPYLTTDGELATPIPGFDLDDGIEVAGYHVAAVHEGAGADACIDVLRCLADDHAVAFDRVMRACRGLSNDAAEIDGLDDLLEAAGQAAFDLAVAREERRDAQGFLAPAQAAAFLRSARQIPLDTAEPPALDPIARAYFRALAGDAVSSEDAAAGAPTPVDSAAPASASDEAEVIASLTAVMEHAGLVEPPRRALLAAPSERQESPLERIHQHLQRVLERDPGAHSQRRAELGYLANALVAGCSVRSRPFTTTGAWDAAVATCNLGFELWPAPWRSNDPGGIPIAQDLLAVFEVGWTALHEMSLDAAGCLAAVVRDLRVADRDTQARLVALQRELVRSQRAGTPWTARPALEPLASFDAAVWAALDGLLDECPVIHAALPAWLARSPHAIAPSAFTFAAGRAALASIRAFLDALPARLRP